MPQDISCLTPLASAETMTEISLRIYASYLLRILSFCSLFSMLMFARLDSSIIAQIFQRKQSRTLGSVIEDVLRALLTLCVRHLLIAKELVGRLVFVAALLLPQL